MPGMNGRQLYDLMKDNSPDLTKKVVFITGDTVSLDTRIYLYQTGNAVVTKPFQLNELLQSVQAIWD